MPGETRSPGIRTSIPSSEGRDVSALDELGGLLDELALCTTHGKKDRADQVRKSIREKRAIVAAEADALDAEAAAYVGTGQDILAGQAAVKVARLRSALESMTPVETRETTDDKPAPRAATTSRKRD